MDTRLFEFHISESPSPLQDRRDCSNIGVAQIVAASRSNNATAAGASAAAASAAAEAASSTADAATAAAKATSPIAAPLELASVEEVVVVDGTGGNRSVQSKDSYSRSYSSFLKGDGSVTIHAAERLGRGIATDAITTPLVNTSAYFFKKTADLLVFKEGRSVSFEYGRYGNPTTVVVEENIREEEMQELNRATNSKMAFYGFLSILVCLSVAGAQFWHLKTFFERKKPL